MTYGTIYWIQREQELVPLVARLTPLFQSRMVYLSSYLTLSYVIDQSIVEDSREFGQKCRGTLFILNIIQYV